MSQQSPQSPIEPNQERPQSTAGPEPSKRSLPAGSSPSLTYEPYYGLKEKPFSLSADPRFLYRSPAHAPVFDELLTGIRRREGLIVLTGEIGTGKTTLIRSVLQQLDRRTFTAFVPDPFVSREDLLKMLLVDFGVVSLADLKRGSLSGASRPDLSYPLYEFLDSLVPLQAFAVLIIDEAQNIPLPLLEEIRILSDLEQREKLLQVVLVGQPELRANMKLPEMRQVDQRVSVRCELSALGCEDVGTYVKHRLMVASGGNSRVEFSDAAITALYAGSRGVPRVINLICDRALQRGFRDSAAVIGPHQIEGATSDLGLGRAAAPAVTALTLPQAVPLELTRGTWDSGPTTRAEEPWPEAPAPRSSVPLRIEEAPREPAAVLSEFAAEEDLIESEARPFSLWRLAASVVITVLAAGAVLAAWYVSFAPTTVGASGSVLPPAPAPVWKTSVRAEVPAAPVGEAAKVDPPRSGVAATGRPTTDLGYAIQVASFESHTRAERLISELSQAGYRARAVQYDRGPGRGPMFKILVDGYQTIDEAVEDLARIRERPGYDDAHLVAN